MSRAATARSVSQKYVMMQATKAVVGTAGRVGALVKPKTRLQTASVLSNVVDKFLHSQDNIKSIKNQVNFMDGQLRSHAKKERSVHYVEV